MKKQGNKKNLSSDIKKSKQQQKPKLLQLGLVVGIVDYYRPQEYSDYPLRCSHSNVSKVETALKSNRFQVKPTFNDRISLEKRIQSLLNKARLGSLNGLLVEVIIYYSGHGIISCDGGQICGINEEGELLPFEKYTRDFANIPNCVCLTFLDCNPQQSRYKQYTPRFPQTKFCPKYQGLSLLQTSGFDHKSTKQSCILFPTQSTKDFLMNLKTYNFELINYIMKNDKRSNSYHSLESDFDLDEYLQKLMLIEQTAFKIKGEQTIGVTVDEEIDDEDIIELNGTKYRRVQIEGEDDDEYLLDSEGNLYDMQGNFIGTANTEDE